MGAVATLIVLLGGGRGLQSVIGSMKLYQIVLAVWFLSSVSEEIFTRGWAQGAMGRWTAATTGRFSPAVILAAILFGSMHLSLFARGVDVVTASTIVCSTTLLGLVAVWLREKHRGLLPAIAVHVCFNVGGMFGGILYTASYRLMTGKMPFAA